MKKRHQRVPVNPVTATIEKFSHDGRGIAKIDGKVVFIEGALPGERVTFRYVRQKNDFNEGVVVSVEEAASDRVAPRCPHYGVCGGCSLQHIAPHVQIQAKQAWLLDILLRIGHVQPTTIFAPLTADTWHYRTKARLSVRYVEKKQAALVGFREKMQPRYITDMHTCSILSEKVADAIDPLRALIASLSNPGCIAQVEIAVGESDAITQSPVVALIFRNLSPLSATDETALKAFADMTQCHLFLQPGGPDSVVPFYPNTSKDYLHYYLPEHDIAYQFQPTDFTQVNPSLNRRMIQHALSQLALTSSDYVLDLFCGLGNFSLPMARQCARVIGVEGSPVMVDRARSNAAYNALNNTDFLCVNLDDEAALSALTSYAFNKVLVDPPRAGAAALMPWLGKRGVERVVYVSCNPATLARDADCLVNTYGYRMVGAGVMDMFPHTAHVESIAVFEKSA